MPDPLKKQDIWPPNFDTADIKYSIHHWIFECKFDTRYSDLSSDTRVLVDIPTRYNDNNNNNFLFKQDNTISIKLVYIVVL